MLPVSIKVKDFLSHKDSTLDFRLFDAACLLGRNGGGKSTMAVEAMKWVLYKRGRYQIQNKMVRRDANEAVVEYVFRIDSNTYRTTRTQNRIKDKQDVVLEIAKNGGWDNISGSTIPETNQKIVELIGLDYEAFTNTVACEQDLAKTFFDKTNTERKEVFQSILPLRECELLCDGARDKRDHYRIKVDTLLSQLGNLEDINANILRLQQEVQQINNIIVQVQESITQTESVLKDLRENQKQYELAINKRESLVATKNKLEFQIEQCNEQINESKEAIEKRKQTLILLRDQHIPYKEKYLTLEEQTKIDIDILKQQCETLLKAKDTEQANKRKHEDICNTLSGQMKNIEMQEATIKQLRDKCITCGKTWTEDEKREALNNFVKERQELSRQRQAAVTSMARFDNVIGNIDKELQEVQAQVNDYEERIRELERTKQMLIKIKGEADVVKNDITNAVKRLEEKQNNSIAIANELTTATAELDKLGEVVERDYAKDINDLESDLRLLQQKLIEDNSNKGRLENELASNEQKKKETIGLQKEIDKAKHELMLYDILITGFGKNGVQSDIINEATHDIRLYANDWCNRLSHGRFTIDIKTQEENKTQKGKFREIFDIIVKDNEVKNGNNEIESCGLSGGELYQVAMALRMALSTILANRIGTKIKFLLIDEAAVALDDNGVEAFADVINTLKEQFKICVVSHRKDLQAYFENIIWVEKENGISKLIQN
jgi:exonuclease SbcC